MSISDKIKKSKESIKYSQKLNISSSLYNCLLEFEKRKDDKEFLMTIPVKIVASNESFFKETFSSLIDFDEKYLNNTKALFKKNNVRIDIEDIYQITQSTFTLGDLISYSFKYSSIESLYKTFVDISNLQIFDNEEALTKNIADDYELEEIVNEKRPIDRNRIFKNLVEVYKVRNIICHDFLSATHKLILEPKRMKEYLMDTYVFQEIITYSISKNIYSKKFPNSYQEYIEYYNSIITEKKQVLDGLYSSLEKRFKFKEQTINLNKVKKAFENFLELDSKYVSLSFRDFEIEDLKDLPFETLTLEYKIKLIDQRIKNIEEKIMYSS